MFRENYEYQNWREVPLAEFKARWPSFSPEEIACNGDGKLMLNFRALDMLQKLRTKIGRPMILNSAYRSPAYNKKIGGATNSMHMRGLAFDCRMENHNPELFERAAVELGFRGIGHYPGSNFMHVDARVSDRVVRWQGTGSNARWFFTAASRPAPAMARSASPSAVPASLLGSRPQGLMTDAELVNVIADGEVSGEEVIDVVGEVINSLPVNQRFHPAIPPTVVMLAKRFWPLIGPALVGPLTTLATTPGPVGWVVAGGMLVVALGGTYYLFQRGTHGPEHENA